MADPIHLDRILEGLDDRLLADHLLENLGPKFSGNDLIFHSGGQRAGPGRGILWHIG